MRAVAVLAVIANHLPAEYLPSGYLGVDVFFVISGFVITASVLNHCPDSLSQLYADFFSKRVKRLLPALFVCVGFTSLYVLFNDPFPEDSIKTGIASLFGLSNLVLYIDQQDYFAASSKFNAFTHTWSLGVEEQFYLLFPVIIWFGFFRKDARNVKRLLLMLGVLTLASLVAFVGLYDVNQPAAYFLTPMRIWELSAGSIAYLFSISNRYQALGSVLGKASVVILALLLCAFFFPPEYAIASLLTVIILTLLLLLSPPEAPAGRLLSISVTVFLGQISYSLYLWHWPVITQKAFGLANESTPSGVYLLLSLVLAVASYYLIERPLRYRKWSSVKGREIGIGFAFGLFIAVSISEVQKLYMESGSTAHGDRYPPRFLPLLSSGKNHNPTCVIDGEKRLLTQTMYEDCTVPQAPQRPMLWVMGDSHAGNLQGMVFEMHREFGTGVHLISTPGIPFPPILDPDRPWKGISVQVSSREVLFQSVLDDLTEGDVILAPRLFFSPHEKGNPVLNNFQRWLDEIPGLAEQLATKGVHLILFGPLPFFSAIEDIRACPSDNRTLCAVKRDYMIEKNTPILNQLNQLSARHDNVHTFNPFPVFCPSDQELCYPDENETFLFSDRSHLTHIGSEKLTKSFYYFLGDNDLLGI